MSEQQPKPYVFKSRRSPDEDFVQRTQSPERRHYLAERLPLEMEGRDFTQVVWNDYDTASPQSDSYQKSTSPKPVQTSEGQSQTEERKPTQHRAADIFRESVLDKLDQYQVEVPNGLLSDLTLNKQLLLLAMMNFVTSPETRPMIHELMFEVGIKPDAALQWVLDDIAKPTTDLNLKDRARRRSQRVRQERLTLLVQQQFLEPHELEQAHELLMDHQDHELALLFTASFTDGEGWQHWHEVRERRVKNLRKFANQLIYNGYNPLEVAAVIRTIATHPAHRLLGDVID